MNDWGIAEIKRAGFPRRMEGGYFFFCVVRAKILLCFLCFEMDDWVLRVSVSSGKIGAVDTPMDYDDNDFQSQNLHLAGEGSTKFPPVLRPYALPKFDFDESLQGQLRFDNLVETEVFLGIESNEDNQWIDAFSRGSSGIEFSSTAAESCSISRHNNVWSEATSSESVEMLLKSVGQEEFIPRQSVIQESDACNELACLAKQMEPNLKADDKNEFRGDVTGLQLPDNVHEDFSGLKEDVGRVQSQVGVSQAHENELSIDGGSSNLELGDICQNINLPVSEGNRLTDGKSNNENLRNVEIVADDSSNNKTLDGSSASRELKANITESPMQNISSVSNALEIQNVQNQVVGSSDEQQGCLTAHTDRQDMESYTLNKETDLATQTFDGNAVGSDAHNLSPPHSISTEEALEGCNVIKGHDTGITNIVDSLGMVSSNVSNLQKAENSSEDIVYRNPSQDSAGGNVVLIKDAMMDDRACDTPKVAIESDTSLGEVVQTNNSNCGTCPNLQQSVDLVEKKTYGESTSVKEEEVLNIGQQTDAEVSVSKADAPKFTVQDNNISNISEGHSDSKVEGFSSFSVASSTKSCILGESTQICENNEVDRLGHKKSHLDVTVDDKDCTKAPSDPSQMHDDADKPDLVDKGTDSSSISPGSVETELPTSSALDDVTAVDNSASKVLSENASLASYETVDIPPSSSNASAHEVMVVHRKTSPVGSSSVDEKEDFATRVAEEAGISTPVVSSQKETAPCPVIGTEKQESFDASRQLVCETVDNSLKTVETCGTQKASKPQKTLGDNQECAKEMDISPVLPEPTAKQDDDVNPSLTISGDMLHANQGSESSAPLSGSHVELHETGGSPANPTNTSIPSLAIGSSSQNENDGNQVKASSNQKPPVSEFINKDATNMLSIAHNLKGKGASKNEGSLASDFNPVAGLTKKGSGRRQSVPATSASKALTVVEVSPSTPGLGPSKTKTAADISRGSPQISDQEIALGGSKSTPQRKTRRASNKTPGKESSRKASHAKEKTPARQPERVDKSNNATLGSPGFQLMQSNEMQQYGHIDSSSAKPFALINASTSSLPDLNTSASSPVLFQQPFTDLQQIQLRAQIFVYGALIQGTAPDEAYMISAFGGPDGGRSLWENAWRMCSERQHAQKSHPANPETPVQSRPGPRGSDSTLKQGSQQGKGISSPLGRSSSKATPTVVNPLIPLSSPLWSLPTPCDSLQPSALARGSVLDYPRVLTSLHPYQTPPPRNFLGHNMSWISQAPVRGPSIASPAPAPAPVPDTSSLFSASPITDSVKLNSVKGSSLPPSSGTKSVTPGVPSSSAGPQSIFVGAAPLLDTSNVTVSPSQHSSDPKPKKRKKVTATEDLSQKALQPQSQLELNPIVSTHITASVALTPPVGSVPKTTVEKPIVSVSPLSPTDHLKSDRNIEKRILSDESLVKVKEAAIHADEAASLSASAVNHSLEIWSQLDKQKNSGLVSDIEAKLASAAFAIAAAAAVAKAAAAAAKVASNAALQAKLMAEEALTSSCYEATSQSNGISHSVGINNIGKATPASILKGANGANSSNSIIVAAKEAVRRKVEAASAARKQAENMDAIVKAAELAAEAVSQAGKIVTMGDPLRISDLVEAGPDGCWKVTQESCQPVGLSEGMIRGPVNIDNLGENPKIPHKLSRDISFDGMGIKIAEIEKSPLHKMYNERLEDNMRPIDGISNSINVHERNSIGPKDRDVSDFVNPIEVVPESQTEIPGPSCITQNGSEKLENNIKEGSLVEVFKDGEGFKSAWFTASVLSLKDGKAYVCYNVLVADEGAGPLKEWVALEREEDKPPRIRVARPLTGLHYEGTRKRRRAAMGDYAWSVGDRVDAWIQERSSKLGQVDLVLIYLVLLYFAGVIISPWAVFVISWQEGVIKEKNKKDEITVLFPASGETSVVRAWHLRPSLIWKDGKWMEYSSLGANQSSTHEGDTPHEKRPKLGSHAVEAKGKDKMLKSIDAVDSVNPDELRLLDLTENEKVFNIGKNNKNEIKVDAHRTARTGLQKEGSRVIFGVPKPGKKRKFMEVSKHYVADRSNKVNDGNDSVKLANFLVPQGSGLRGWKNSSKNDTKEKRGAESKPKTVKPGKPSAFGRTVQPKDNPSANATSHPSDLTEGTEKIKDSASHYKNASNSENQVEMASYSATDDGATEGPILYSSLASSSDASSSKRTATSRSSKGKLAPAGGKLSRIEEEKPTNEASEPRRSNRRIQPTSRLLEGLQSSLIIPKLPSVSHDKGHKNQNRNASRGEPRNANICFSGFSQTSSLDVHSDF
ncbi:uncharacterized protein G2W53_036846 [Senna tora]|uniref:Agenet-like domain-containing protein n=1 Tax=Senna tora TaxID=362788 RepID=A0A834SV76_9FABA|nr:uncharacterized protein G2W53_036846 [Senna tora]